MQYRQVILNPAQSRNGVVPVQWHEPGGASAPIPSVPGLSFVNIPETRSDPITEDARAAKNMFEKCQRLEKYLGMPGQTFKPLALSETFGAETLQVESYVRAEFNDKRGYFIHVRGAGDLVQNQPIRKVRFVTGPCLFSNDVLEATDTEGKLVNILHPQLMLHRRLKSIVAVDQLSLYELEGCVRPARLIADMAGALPDTMEVSVSIDVPRVQYYSYLLEGMADGLVSKDLLQKWVAMVDRRHEQLVTYLRKQLQYWFAQVGRPSPVVTTSAGLEVLREELVGAIESGSLPTMDNLLETLASHYPAWGLVNRAAPPKTLRQLSYYSYSMEYLGEFPLETSGKVLQIVVEDRSETKIMEGVKKIYELIKAHTPVPEPALLGLYPISQMLIANEPNSSLYLNDPGSRFSDDLGEYSSQELVNAVYGVRNELAMA